MDIVLFGIQGSGKGTQAKKLCAGFEYNLFEAGGELRTIAASGSELGNTVKSYIDAGEHVPADVILQVVRTAVGSRKPGQQIIFDGIPRNEDQKEEFDRIMQDAGRTFRCILLTVDEERAVQRILKRASIEGRADDASEESIRRRMQLFHEKTEPVIEEYRSEGKMTDVDGDGDVEEVFQRFLRAVRQS